LEDTIVRATWKPHDKSGTLTSRADLPSSVFAYPKERKEPMTNASHVRNAIARFNQVTGVAGAEHEQAFANIKKAAKHYGVDMSESKASDLGKSPARKKTARKKATRKKATRKKTSAKKTTRKKSTAQKSTRKKTTRKKTVRKTAKKKR
jgi:hypothetical protein